MLWEWGGRTISPHPHAHSTPLLTSLWRKNLHALSNSRPHNFVFHLHALSPLSDSLHAQALGGLGLTQTFSSLHELLSPHALQIRVLAIVAHLHAGNCCCYSRTPNFASSLCSVHFPPLPVHYSFPRTGIFLVFTHVVFLHGFVNDVAESFSPWVELWVLC